MLEGQEILAVIASYDVAEPISELFCQFFDIEKVLIGNRYPVFAIERQRAAGYETVQVYVALKLLTPGVKHGGGTQDAVEAFT
jgi:hypothetical protein